jgi:hypothetical protein
MPITSRFSATHSGCEWSTSERAVSKIQTMVKDTGEEVKSVVEHDIPTDKKGLLNWLYENCRSDKG